MLIRASISLSKEPSSEIIFHILKTPTKEIWVQSVKISCTGWSVFGAFQFLPRLIMMMMRQRSRRELFSSYQMYTLFFRPQSALENTHIDMKYYWIEHSSFTLFVYQENCCHIGSSGHSAGHDSMKNIRCLRKINSRKLPMYSKTEHSCRRLMRSLSSMKTQNCKFCLMDFSFTTVAFE